MSEPLPVSRYDKGCTRGGVMELKPGEYVGQDGATYSVTHIYAKWRDGDGTIGKGER